MRYRAVDTRSRKGFVGDSVKELEWYRLSTQGYPEFSHFGLKNLNPDEPTKTGSMLAIDSLREVHGSINSNEIIRQINEIKEKEAFIISAVGDDIKPILKQRINYLMEYRNKLITESTGIEATCNLGNGVPEPIQQLTLDTQMISGFL